MPLDLHNPVRLYVALRIATALAMATAFTTSAVYRINIGELSAFQLVLIGTVLEASVFLFEVPTGVVADTFSRRLSLIIGLAIIAAGLVIEGAFSAFETIMLAQVVWGLGYTFTSGATEAWLSDEAGEDNAERGFFRAAQFAPVGALTGIGLGAGLAAVSLHIPYFVGGGMMLAVATALLIVMPESGFTPTPRAERHTFRDTFATFTHGLRVVRGRAVLLLIMAISLGGGLWSEAFDRLWELQFLDNFAFPSLGGLDPVIWFGIINAAALLMGIAVIEGINRFVRGRDAPVLAATLGGATALMAAALAAFALAGSFAMALGAYWTVRIIYRASGPLTTAWLNRGLESRVRATVFSMHGQMNAIGQVVGGPIVGLIGSTAGVRTALFVSALVLVPVVALYGLAVRATRRERAGAELELPPVGAEEVAEG